MTVDNNKKQTRPQGLVMGTDGRQFRFFWGYVPYFLSFFKVKGSKAQ